MDTQVPLETFLEWLAHERDWPVDLHDRCRIGKVLQSDHSWSMEQLGYVLASILTHDPDQAVEFRRHYRSYFPPEDTSAWRPRPLDRPALMDDLQLAAGADPPPWKLDEPAELAAGSGQPAVATGVPRSRTGDARPIAQVRFRQVSWPADLPAPSTGGLQGPRQRIHVDWDPEGPCQFFLADVGEPVGRMLDESVLDELADSMGYFQGDRPSRHVDLRRSLRESLEQGCPSVRFLPGRQVCQLLVLEDTRSEARIWNSAPVELALGMAHRGVPVTHGLFRGSPDRFRIPDQSAVVELEDWEQWRDGVLVVLFTEGKGLYRRGPARVLDHLALWPKLAWIDLREPAFWDGSTQQAADRGIPVFPATSAGLRDMGQSLLTERGRDARTATAGGARSQTTWPLCSLAGLPLPQRLDRILDDARAWAETCAVLPCVPRRLGDQLRRTFHPDVPPSAWGRLYALPDTTHDAEGLHFSLAVLRILRRGFYARRSESKQREIFRFVRRMIETTGELLPADSLARYEREGILLSLSCAEGRKPDPQEILRLTQSDLPLAPAITQQFSRDVQILDAEGQLTAGQRDVLRQCHILTSPRSPYPDDLVPIPAGTFLMGDPTGEGDGDERPQHPVEVNTFYIAKHPVTWELWQEVYGWAVKHRYQFDNPGAGRGPKHPVTDVSWYDAVKWCNARSEKEGRCPAYYTNPSQTEPYRQGQLDLPAEAVEWANGGRQPAGSSAMLPGYRLPTEAEWEKAARGGLEGHHYPWESHGKGYEQFISPDKANYDKSKKNGTTPVGTYPPNGYGLFDMAGNVYDWVWDRWDDGWYRKPDATESDTCGPSAGVSRVFRGGSWWYSAWFLRCAFRSCWHPSRAIGNQGFRLAGGQAEAKPAKLDEGGERGSRDETLSEPPESSGADHACLTVELVPPRVAGLHVVAGLRPSHEAGPQVSGSTGDLTVGPAAGSGDPRRTRPDDTVRLTSAESSREVPTGEPVVLDAGQCRVTAARRFCWPVTTAHELEPGKAYHLRILMQRQPPPGMVEIPAGTFQMGDPTSEGFDWERPQHDVFVGAFFIAQHQVTWALWREVYDWAVRHGYQFENQGGGYGDDHPVHSVNWYDAAKWCNAYSEREHRDPTYFEDRIGGKVYRQGDVNVSAAAVDWNGEGLRLPTEAEWEKAARGGLVGHHYPWESEGAGYERFITPDKANYDASEKGQTTTVGSYPANGYDLYDMAGNVWEWCWDRWDTGWYRSSGATDPNVRGPDSGVFRVSRGGGWRISARDLRCAFRGRWLPSSADGGLGFRLAGGQVQAAQLDEGGERGSRDETLSEPPEESGAVIEARGILEKFKDLFRGRRK